MIVVNARFLTQKTTGVQRFAIEICKALNKSKLEIEFVAPHNIINTETAKELNVKTIGYRFLSGHLWEQLVLPLYVIRKRAFLISFCNTAPLVLKNQIITVHDVGFKINREWISRSFFIYYNIVIPIVAKRAKHILTVSKTSKKDIVKMLKVPKSKVSVVYNAVSSVFEQLHSTKNEDANFGFNEDYVLTVSSHHPRKNFERLIKAFELIPDQSLKLYIIGDVNKNFVELNFENHESDRVRYLKNIDDRQLALYYKNAKLFVYASLFEGFGIPIIEAMSQNIPVCVSDIEVFREVCGDNAVYFCPTNINDMALKMSDALNSKFNQNFDLTRYDWTKSAYIVEQCINKYVK